MSRTTNTIKNLKFSFFAQILSIGLNFVTRSFFIHYLNSNLLGLNGLFSNILSLLSLVELGLGNAIVFSLYKPIANDDEEMVLKILAFFKKSYNIIAVLIFIIGVSLIPFLPFFLKESDQKVNDLILIYFLFLMSTSLSYVLSYKRTLLIASQKQYIENINNMVINIFKNLLQILILYFFSSYIYFLIVQIVMVLLSNFLINKKANELFPFLNSDRHFELDDFDKKVILKNVASLSIHKFAGVIVFSITNILISKYIGLIAVGIYSNYFLIISSINSFIILFFNSLSASVGNLGAIEDKDKVYDTFKLTELINFWMYGASSILLYLNLNSFIQFWIGIDFIMDSNIVLILIINFYITGRRINVLTFKSAMGLFNQDRYKPIVESLINILLSLYFLEYYGLIGAFLSLLLSTLVTSFWIEPYILFKYSFSKSVFLYFRDYLIKLIILLVSFIVIFFIVNQINTDSIYGIIFKFIISFILTNSLFYLFLYRSENFIKLKQLVNEKVF
jgi:O-antigen/teichoic acid export membrane protein